MAPRLLDECAIGQLVAHTRVTRGRMRAIELEHVIGGEADGAVRVDESSLTRDLAKEVARRSQYVSV